MAPSIAAEVCTAELVGVMAETHSGAPLRSRRHLEPRRKVIEQAASRYLTAALAALAALDPVKEGVQLASLANALAAEAAYLERGTMRRREMERLLHKLFGPPLPSHFPPEEIATQRRMREQLAAVMVDVVMGLSSPALPTAEAVQSFFLDPLRAVTQAAEPTPEMMALAQDRLEALALRLAPTATPSGDAVESLKLRGSINSRVAAARVDLVGTVVAVLERWTKVPAVATYSDYADDEPHAGPTVRALQMLLHSLASRLEAAGAVGEQAVTLAGLSPSAAALRRDIGTAKARGC